MMKYDDKIQLIMIGESSVGKTSILYKYTQGFFTSQHLATVGIEYFTKEEKIDEKTLRVRIWDTAGQEQYRSLTRNFYRNSDGVVIVYDVTSKASYSKVKEWVESVNDNTDRHTRMILVGNKIDLPREVSTEEGQRLATGLGISYFETSAKENIGIDECMRFIIQDVYTSKKPKKEGISLADQSNVSEQGSGCRC